MNPADQPVEDFFFTREPILTKIDQFFRLKSTTHGDNQLFILSDTGMGKTALLTMLKLMHLTAFWPSRKDCVLKKLGEKTLEEITAVENKHKTILLLDSLDEDPEAYGKVHERIMDILDATQHFLYPIQIRWQFIETENDFT
jgi:hypothetical protein